MVNREDIVRHPEHLGLIALEQALDFVHHRLRRAPAMSSPIDRVTAPVASVRTSTSRYDGNRAFSVMSTPGLQIFRHVDPLAIGPWLGVQILNENCRTGPEYSAIASTIDYSRNIRPFAIVKRRAHDAFQSQLAFPGDYDVRARIEILLGIIR